MFNATILLILISSLVSSTITERYGKRLVLEESKKVKMENKQDSNKILVPIANPQTTKRLIDLAILQKDTKSHSPIYPLAVVKDDQEVEVRMAQLRPILDKIVRQSAASGVSGVSVQTTTRMDVNIPTAISRASKELNVWTSSSGGVENRAKKSVSFLEICWK